MVAWVKLGGRRRQCWRHNAEARHQACFLIPEGIWLMGHGMVQKGQGRCRHTPWCRGNSRLLQGITFLQPASWAFDFKMGVFRLTPACSSCGDLRTPQVTWEWRIWRRDWCYLLWIFDVSGLRIKEKENRDVQMIFPPPMDHSFNHTVNILILHTEDAGDLHFTKACKIQFVFFSVPRDLWGEDGMLTDVYDKQCSYKWPRAI